MKTAWLLALVGVAAVLPYAAVPTHDWLNWDDNWLMWDNPTLDKADLATVKMVLFDLSLEARGKLGDEYLPLRDLSIMLDKQLWGNEPAGYFVENILFYGITAGLFFVLLLRVHRDRLVATVAGLLFAVHPVHVEAVAWATSRKDVLSAMFFMASAVCFEGFLAGTRGAHPEQGEPRPGRWRWVASSCLFFSLAVASKGTAIVLPLWIVLRLVWQWVEGSGRGCGQPGEGRGEWRGGRGRFRDLAVLVPFTAIAAFQLSLLVRAGSTTEVLAPSRASGSLVLDLATTVLVNGRYLYNLLLPVSLGPDYPVRTIESLTSLRGLVAVASVLLIAGWLVWAGRSVLPGRSEETVVPDGGLPGSDHAAWTASLFWVLWFFGAQLPFSQLVPIYNKMTDRYLMLPSMGFAALLGFFAVRAWERRRHVAIPILVGVVLLALSLLTFRQASYWKDSITLWSRGVAVQPTSIHALYQLSTAYQDEGRSDEERQTLERLLEVDPDHAGGMNNLGINLFRAGGDRDEIIALYERLIRRHPADFKAQQNLANVLIAERRFDEAIDWLESSLRVNPTYCSAMLNLGRAHAGRGDAAAARRAYDRALACNPGLQVALELRSRLPE